MGFVSKGEGRYQDLDSGEDVGCTDAEEDLEDDFRGYLMKVVNQSGGGGVSGGVGIQWDGGG